MAHFALTRESQMTIQYTLWLMRQLLTSPSRWTQGRFVAVAEDGGRRWCLSGALQEVGGQIADATYKHLADTLGVANVCEWNDHPLRTHDEVLAALDRAIEAAPARS